jgi:MFS transporter, DHA2 family, methylenomycin A resistance protein
MTQTSADARAPVATRRAWAALAVVAGGLFLAVMSTTVVSVALPTIGRHLHANATDLEWIVDAYVVVYASLLVPGGVIGDRRGRKGLFMLGVAIFGLGSLITGLAPSVGLLLIGRVIQGLGPALLVPGSLTIIRTVFEDERQRAVAIGLWSTASGLALAIGPALGGLLVDRFGWRWVFLFNVPLAAAFVVLAARFVPRLARTPIRSRFDWLGAILSTGAVAILAYASIEGQDHGWSVALAGFIAWERHRTDSLIDVTLFARPTFTAANVAALVVFFAFVGSIVYFSAYFQQVQGHSPIAAGLDVSAIGVAFAVTASQSGRLVSRFGPRRPMLAGLVIAGVATLGLLRLAPNTGIDAIWWNFAVLGGGIGMCLTPMTAVAISAVDASRAGMVSAVHNSLRQLGQVFGVALLGALVYARLPGAAGPRLDRAQGALFVGGLHNALWVCGLALLAAAALAALLFSLPGPGNPGEKDSQADEVPGGARRIGDRHPELPLAGQRPPTAGFMTDTAQAPARSGPTSRPRPGPGVR